MVGNRNWLCIAKVLLLFWMNIKGDSDSRDYPFLQYMQVTRSIDMVDKTLGLLAYAGVLMTK